MSTPSNPIAPRPEAPAIYWALNKIMSSIGAIAKARTTTQQGNYAFRSIDDFYERVQPLLVEAGVVVMPETIERSQVDRDTKGGGRMIFTSVKVKFTFTATADGSATSCTTCGEGADPGDKSTAKAHSSAYKTALTEVFCVPVGTGEDRGQSQGNQARQNPEETGEVLSADDLKSFKADLHAALQNRGFLPDEEPTAVRAICNNWRGNRLEDLTAHQAKTTIADVRAGRLDSCGPKKRQTQGAA